MSSKKMKPRLSKGILEMKFMQRTKAKVDKDIADAESRSMYSSEISEKMLNSKSNYILEPSFMHCENLIEGRLSFRGMNPEIERILELEHAEREAAKRHEQPKEITDKDMAAFYHAHKAPAATKTMHKKFQKKGKRSADYMENQNKKMKFIKPKSEEDDDEN